LANWLQRNLPWLTKRHLQTNGAQSAPYSLTDDAIARILGIETLSANASPRTAMGIATFFGCVRFISDLIASQPYGLYKKLPGGGSASATDHPLHDLIHTRPNAQMSSFIARRTLVMNFIVYGYAVAQIYRDENYRTVGFKPFPSSKVSVLEDPLTGFNFFQITTNSGMLTLSEDEVIFLKDTSFDGTTGGSIVKWQPKTIKTELLIKNFTERFYEKGTFMSGFLTTDLDPKNHEAAKIYKERFVEALEGDETGGYGFAILGMNAKWEKVGITPIEAQILPLLERTDKEICKMFGVPLAMIGDTEKTTSWGTGVEQAFIGVTNTVIIPKAIQIEQEIDYKCLSASERKKGYYTKMNFRNLLRGDAKSYGEYIAKMVQIGAFNQDEVRAWEEMAPIEGGHGKYYWIQGAMMRIDQPRVTSKQKQKDEQRQKVSTSDN
jgi:HK97 family phage portal protein